MFSVPIKNVECDSTTLISQSLAIWEICGRGTLVPLLIKVRPFQVDTSRDESGFTTDVQPQATPLGGTHGAKKCWSQAFK